MRKTEDLRITKTKAALHNAFFSMLAETSIEDITVNNLCEKANIRRATFYKHFNDKLDFITYIIKDIRYTFDSEFIDNTSNSALSIDYYVKYIEAVISFMMQRESAISKILASPMRSVFIEIFMQQNYLDTVERLKMSVAEGLVISTSVEAASCMIVGGVSISILRWFENRNTLSAQVMINEVSTLVGAILS